MLRWTSERRLTGPITSTTNQVVKEVVRLHRAKHRRDAGLILLEGPQLAEEAVHAGVRVEFGLTTDPASYPDAIEVTAEVLAKASTTATPNALLLVASVPPDAVADGDAVAVLWNVADPGNVGALVRSAAAFGFEVLVVGESADPWSPKALRAGAGGQFHTTVQVVPDLSLGALHDRGFVTIATVARDGGIPPHHQGRVALLIGGEANGLPPEVAMEATSRWTIPMTGVESLNASVAGSIAMFSVAQWRG